MKKRHVITNIFLLSSSLSYLSASDTSSLPFSSGIKLYTLSLSLFLQVTKNYEYCNISTLRSAMIIMAFYYRQRALTIIHHTYVRNLFQKFRLWIKKIFEKIHIERHLYESVDYVNLYLIITQKPVKKYLGSNGRVGLFWI